MWILPKALKQSFQSALEAQGSTEELTLPSDIWADEASRSLMWRGKPLPPKSWQRAWTREPWVQRLSTRTLPSSTDDRLSAWWTESLEAIPASPSALLESALEMQTLDTSGPTSSDSSDKSTPSGASSRTFAGICLSEHTRSSATFKGWTSELRLASTLRKKSGRLTRGSAFSFWPTPTVCGNYNAIGASPTSGDGLETKAKKWATPTARDWKDGYDPSMEVPSSKCRLGLQVPRTPPVGTNTSSEPRALNPRFVERLMGWPDGWTDSGCSETE